MTLEDPAVRRLQAAVAALSLRMKNAAGDLDYESCLHEKRALEAALISLRKRRAADEKKEPEQFHPDFSRI